MLSSLRLAVITILLASTLSSEPTSAEISKRSRYFEDARRERYTTVYYESKNRGKRESDPGEERNTKEVQNSWLESTVEELADATGSHGYTDHSNVGNYANHHESNRRSMDARRWQHDSVPGTPGMDYPNHETIPVTSFTCMDKEPGGYYADVETGCQVFHVCNIGGTKSSFMCPPGSIFNQNYFVCDWWYRFDCNDVLDNNEKKKQDDFRYSSQPEVIYEKDESEAVILEKIEESKNIETNDKKYLKNARIRDYKPQNDLLPAGSGERGSDHSRQATRRNDESSRESMNNVRDDSRKDENRKSREKINDNVPRGFSRDRDESLREKTHDRLSQQDMTNDLASYVNYSYFEAKLNNNDDYSNFDNNNNNNNRGKNEPEVDSRIEINFGKKSN